MMHDDDNMMHDDHDSVGTFIRSQTESVRHAYRRIAQLAADLDQSKADIERLKSQLRTLLPYALAGAEALDVHEPYGPNDDGTFDCACPSTEPHFHANPDHLTWTQLTECAADMLRRLESTEFDLDV